MCSSVGTLARRSVVLLAAVIALVGLVLGAEARASAASAASPTTGVVNIDTALGYEQSAAAGTGIVLTTSGEVMTNNHVIRGATRVRVTDPATGRTYGATVVGYSLSGDIALLKLSGASRLRAATVGNSSKIAVRDRVTAVGNAGGRGGAPAVTTGAVTGLHRSITVANDQGGSAHLTDLIETSAALEPGDSGGPLLDSSGRVIGIDTAVDSGFDLSGGGNGFAIPINRALAIVKQIETGRSTASVHVGPTSFIGISVGSPERAAATSGAFVSGVLSGSPADKAGLRTGDVITSLAGHAISSPTALVNTLLHYPPGAALRVRWSGQDRIAHNATIRPIAGPPQ